MNNDFLQKVNEEISVEENARLTDPDKMELAPEVRAALIDEILDLHHEYEYKSTTYGVEKVVDAWWENKGRAMTQLFGNHPNYVPGKFQIVFDSDYNRKIDMSIVSEFLAWVFDRLIDNEESYPEEVATYKEWIGRRLRSGYDSIHKRKSGEVVYLKTEAFNKVHGFYSVFRRALELGKTHILTEQAAQEINDVFPDIRAREGQKKSRAIGKMCKKLGIDKHPDYNREYAKLCDAVNPLNIVRHTIISWNPVDYYTMSFGNSWASCHTIDKKNIRRGNENYSGCYSGGTISYMLDGVSVVFYTVDKQYDGEEFELQDKINRCMFHAEINTKSCYCEKCGFDGDIPLVEDVNGKLKWQCPNCGNDDNTMMDIAFRVCGYIGTAKNGGNQGRYGDIHDRVYHLDDMEYEEK